MQPLEDIAILYVRNTKINYCFIDYIFKRYILFIYLPFLSLILDWGGGVII